MSKNELIEIIDGTGKAIETKREDVKLLIEEIFPEEELERSNENDFRVRWELFLTLLAKL